MTTPSRAASRLERSKSVRVLARIGLAAIGVLHILIGTIALAIAQGARGNASQSGALQTLASAPGGSVVLWLVVLGLIFLSLWQILQAFTVHARREKLIEVAKCVVYAGLAAVAISVAAGNHSNSTASDKSSSAKLLALPGGVFVLGAIGLAVIAVGIVFFFNGSTRRFERDLRLPPDSWARVIAGLGRVGYMAKGAALVIVGGLIVFGAIAYDPSKAGGLDGSLRTLTTFPFGVVLLIAIALGLIAYGLFWVVRAFASSLKEP